LLSLVGQRLDAELDALRAVARERLRERRLALTTIAAALERRSPYGQLARWSERTQALGAKLRFHRQARASQGRQALERANAALFAGARRAAERRRERLAMLARRWAARLAERRQSPDRLRREVARAEAALRRAIAEATRRRRGEWTTVAQVFAAVNYRSVLARGYALVLDRSGAALTRAEDAKAAHSLTIRFSDGDLEATTGARPRKKRSVKSAPASGQDSLF
jgi:exodeoxyribonuclease VII large subunit